ncbi:transcription factor with AP2 domain(s), putative [Plasmodium vinckei lentum]|uniref:Transcription factor with AP2 domain(S), putative n=1 Tax=Plasmodium vinckei lentum TaxID=138297 RepID=A0A6V7SIR7_PLAVN|nr:transcription factor with AP2 domain(s), putative [Plasmodium vinckei lentum]
MKPEDENFDNIGEDAYIQAINQINIISNKCIINSSNDGGIKIGVNQKDYDLYISQLKSKNPKELFQMPMDTYAHGIVSGEGDSDDIPTTNSSSSKNDNNNNKNNNDNRDKGDEMNEIDPPLRKIKKNVDNKITDLECYNNPCGSDGEYNDLCNKTTNNIKNNIENNIKLNVDFLIKCNDSNDTTISASTSCTNTKLLRQSSDLNNLNTENYIFNNIDDNKIGSNTSKIKEICNENYIYDKEESLISDSVNNGNVDNTSKGSSSVLFSRHSKLNYNYEPSENTKCIIYDNNIDNHTNCKIDKEYNNISMNNFLNNLKKSKNNINTAINNDIINYDLLNEKNKNPKIVHENTYDLLNNTELANKLNKFCNKIQKKKITKDYNFVDHQTNNIINIEHDINEEETEVIQKNGIQSMLMHIKNINNLSSDNLTQSKDQHLEQADTNCLNSNNDLSDHDEKKKKKRKRINDSLALNNIKKQINSINPYKNYIYNNETVDDPNHQQMIAQAFFNKNEMGKINSEHIVNDPIDLLNSEQNNKKNGVKSENIISENYNKNVVANNVLPQIARSPIYQKNRKTDKIENDSDIYEKESEHDNNSVDECKAVINGVKNEINVSDDVRTNNVSVDEPAASIDNDITTYHPPNITNEVYSKRPQRNAAKKCINLWSEELKKKSEKMYGLQDKGKNGGVDSKREEKLLKKKEKEREKKEGIYLNKTDLENNEEGMDEDKDDKQKKKIKKIKNIIKMKI